MGRRTTGDEVEVEEKCFGGGPGSRWPGTRRAARNLDGDVCVVYFGTGGTWGETELLAAGRRRGVPGRQVSQSVGARQLALSDLGCGARERPKKN